MTETQMHELLTRPMPWCVGRNQENGSYRLETEEGAKMLADQIGWKYWWSGIPPRKRLDDQ